MMAGTVRILARRSRSNNAEVAHIVGMDIVAGRYRAGEKLPGDPELTQHFGVSRPVVRESMKTLAAKGLLTSKARVGTVVCDRSGWNMFDRDVLAWHLESGVDRQFLQDLSEIRLAVEPGAAGLAAQRRTEADLAALDASMERMRHEASDASGFADADLALHLAVAIASGNPFMRSAGAVIEAALRVSFLLSAPVVAKERAIVLAAHQRIVDEIRNGRPEPAADAIRGVIHNGLRRHGALRDPKPARKRGAP